MSSAPFSDWVGRTDTTSDLLALRPAAALAATLDRDLRLTEGAPLPHLWHWIYFTPQAATAALGEDGHPQRGGFLPPIELPRRMWAGGRLTFHRDLRIGERVERTTTIASITEKRGETGQLLFVTLHHRLSSNGELALEEEQDLVYRAPPPAAAAGPASVPAAAAPEAADWERTLVPDPVLLFRYSALTFNSHRIHYDLPYATEVEGYPALVVHGPLLATLLMDLHHRQQPDATVRGFSFRARQPSFAGRPLRLAARRDGDDAVALQAGPATGGAAMTATLHYQR